MTPGLCGAEPPPVIQAAAAWACIDVLSDVHLQEAAPATFDAWARHLLSTPAQAVLILGDLFEVWVGDDARDGVFEQRCAHVLREAAKSRELWFMPGNRDFLVGDELLAECSVRRLTDPTVLVAHGHRYALSHGDALCLDDVEYQVFRRQVRSAAWQRQFLVLPLPERRSRARVMRDASMAHQTRRAADAQAPWFDVDRDAARELLTACRATTLIHGHTHRPGLHDLGDGMQRRVLGDWDCDHAPARASMLRITAGGCEVVDLLAA